MTQPPESPYAHTFVPARFGGEPRTMGAPIWVVLHSIEGKDSMATAENVAAWFHGPASSHASAHYVVDVDSAVQLVAEDRTAWAAGHTGNQLGIHIELSGYAKQTWDDWAADEDMISRAADLVADILQRHGLPCEWVDVEGLRARQPGVTTHAALSQAFHESDHWDPGSGFDMEKFLELVYQRMPGAAG